MPVKAISKYLARYAEADAQLMQPTGQLMAQAVVIPAYGEGESLQAAVRSVPGCRRGPVLIVVVINGRAESPVWAHEANQRAVAAFTEAYPETRRLDESTTLHAVPQGSLVVMQRTLPDGQGVGLARKHGVDLVFGLWARGGLRTAWIHCTDADATVPDDYFEQTEEITGAATLYPFWHLPDTDPTLAQAISWYEISLRYYVLGLRWAGSPYGFHSIGSTMAVDARAYACVRGFPRRSAAEDFYLLNKLTKVGIIHQASGQAIRIAGRVSSRVPFGTGRSMGIAAAGDAMPLCYHPATFQCLRAVLTALRSSIADGEELAATLDAAELSAELRRSVQEAVLTLGLPDALQAARAACRDAATLQRRMHEWLDAFRTMKLIHTLRDAGLPSLEPVEALSRAPFFDPPVETDDLDTWRHSLMKRERAYPQPPMYC